MTERETIQEVAERPEVLLQYLTAEWGMDLRIWSDKTWDLEQYNTQEISEFKPHEGHEPHVIARIRCPGMANLDSSDFTTDFCEWDEDKEAYVTPDGRVIGSMADVIRHCIEAGDMTTYYDELQEKLLNSLNL